MRYDKALERVQESIISGDAAPALHLVKDKPQLTAAEMLNIYIDGYKIRLGQAVRTDYPALGHYIGDATLNALIDGYVSATPSRSYSLDFYSFGFWQFMRRQKAAPAACDLAELEGAVAETFIMPGSAPLTLQDMAKLGGEALGEVKFTLRTASRLLHLAYDAEDYLQAFKRGEAGTAPAPKTTCLFVYRHNNEVKRVRLDEAEYALLAQIAEGRSFGDAIEAVLATGSHGEDALSGQVMEWLPKWIGEGFFTVVSPENQDKALSV